MASSGVSLLKNLEQFHQQFFDDHEINSLASFAMDRTSATEARVLYQGKDDRVPYAKAQVPGQQTEPVA